MINWNKAPRPDMLPSHCIEHDLEYWDNWLFDEDLKQWYHGRMCPLDWEWTLYPCHPDGSTDLTKELRVHPRY